MVVGFLFHPLGDEIQHPAFYIHVLYVWYTWNSDITEYFYLPRITLGIFQSLWGPPVSVETGQEPG